MYSPMQKLSLVVRTIENWPLAILDRAGLEADPVYRLRNGTVFQCRGRSTDLAEVVVVNSGREYPIEQLEPLCNDAVVLDIGANIGAFAIWLSAQYRARNLKLKGWAIEPNPQNVELLLNNLRRNGADFKVSSIAISDHDGEVQLDTSGGFDAASVVKVAGDLTCLSLRLSSFCKEHRIHRIDLIKMDIEGHEYAVLHAERRFVRERVGAIVLEWHESAFGSRATLEKLFAGDFDLKDVRGSEAGGVLVMSNRNW